MMHSNQAIYDECRRAAVQIERQLEEIQKIAERNYPVHQEPDPNAMYKLQDRYGNLMAAPLIAAKANLLSSMAVLKASTNAPAGKGRGW